MKGSNFLRPGQMIDSSRSNNEQITPPPMTTIYVTFLQLVGLLVINIGVQAEPIYRWQDAEGVSHFSDRLRREGYSDRLTPTKSFSDLARQQLTSMHARLSNLGGAETPPEGHDPGDIAAPRSGQVVESYLRHRD